jgi:3-oxoacyl-[acyl-carrier protein] reductase
MIDPKIEGKVALITGANHGIGAVTAKALAKQGVQVFITYYRPPVPYSEEELSQALQKDEPGLPFYYAKCKQKGEIIADEILHSGATAAAWETDLGEAANIPVLFSRCEQNLGPVDVLVINHTHYSPDTFDPELATGERNKPILADTEIIDRHLLVNARATALMIREYVGRHVARGAKWGRIITLTTVAAHAASVSYAASKNAIVSYSLSAAQELGKYGIAVNIVCPGANQTGYISTENEKWIVGKTPLGRLGTPEDTADIITFLASEQGGWLTGNLIYSAGGFNAFMNE